MEIVRQTLKEIIHNEYCKRIIITLIVIALFQNLTPESLIQKLKLSGAYILIGFLLAIYLIYNNLKAIYTLTSPTRDEWEIEFKYFVLNIVKYSFATSLVGLIPFLLLIIYLKSFDLDLVISFFPANNIYIMCIYSLIQFIVTIGFWVSIALRTNKNIFFNTYKVITIKETNSIITLGFSIEVVDLFLNFLNRDSNSMYLSSLQYLLSLVSGVYLIILAKRIQFIKPIL